MDYVLLIDDGPAEGQRIEMSVPPGWTRWFCERGDQESWWIIHAPPEDPDIKVTRYDCITSGLDSEDEMKTVLHFRAMYERQ